MVCVEQRPRSLACLMGKTQSSFWVQVRGALVCHLTSGNVVHKGEKRFELNLYYNITKSPPAHAPPQTVQLTEILLSVFVWSLCDAEGARIYASLHSQTCQPDIVFATSHPGLCHSRGVNTPLPYLHTIQTPVLSACHSIRNPCDKTT